MLEEKKEVKFEGDHEVFLMIGPKENLNLTPHDFGHFLLSENYSSEICRKHQTPSVTLCSCVADCRTSAGAGQLLSGQWMTLKKNGSAVQRRSS